MTFKIIIYGSRSDFKKSGQLHERSKIIHENGNWYYLDGEFMEPLVFGRNEPCWCGRFSLNITLGQIRQHFPVDFVTCELEPRSEVFPSQQVQAIIMHQSKTRLGLLTWGLIPSWAKEKK